MYEENLATMFDIFETQLTLIRREREELTKQIRELQCKREELRTLEERLEAGLDATEALQNMLDREETSE